MSRAKVVLSTLRLKHLKRVARRGAVPVGDASKTFLDSLPELCRLRLVYWDEDLANVLLTPRGTKFLAAL